MISDVTRSGCVAASHRRGHGPRGRGQDDGALAPGGVHHGEPVASPSLDGGVPARRQRIGQPEAAGVEAEQPGELRHPLGVAEPVGLVDGLVDGDHEPAVELEHVDRRGAGLSGAVSPDLVADVDTVPERVLGQGRLHTRCSLPCRAARPSGATPGALWGSGAGGDWSAQRAPRTRRPGSAPVGSPCSNVTVPPLMVATYPDAFWSNRRPPAGRSFVTNGAPSVSAS